LTRRRDVPGALAGSAERRFGPFILHTDPTGRVLDALVPTPGVLSPDNPFLLGRTPNLASSNGFEAMAPSKDGRTLRRACSRSAAESGVRRRHELRIDGPQPGAAGLQRLDRREGAAARLACGPCSSSKPGLSERG